MTIALITARGGSKRLPNKNKRLFCGIPLVAWSIIQAKCSRYIDDVFLTTDDDDIMAIGCDYGARVIKRAIMDDDISAGYVLKLAVEEIKTWGVYPDNIVYMLPTSPIKKTYDLDCMIKEFNRLNVDELGTYALNKETYIFKNLDGNDFSNYLENVISDKSFKYSVQCGGWGIGKTKHLMDFWLKQEIFDSEIDANLDRNIGKKIYGYNVELWQCFETDYEDMFRLCEVIMETFILNGHGPNVYYDYIKSIKDN